jgi:hypothetical protein
MSDMYCPRCLHEEFEHMPNVIHAENYFGLSGDREFPDERPGPSLQCTNCNLVFVNCGTHLEIEPDYLPAA